MEVIQAEVRRQVERELEGRNRRLRELEEENRRLREGNVGSIAPAAPPKVNANGLGGFLGGLFPGSGGFWANASRSSPAPPPPPPFHSPSVLLPPPLPPHPSLQSASYGSVASGHPPSGAYPNPSYPSGLVPGVPSGVTPLASASEHAVRVMLREEAKEAKEVIRTVRRRSLPLVRVLRAQSLHHQCPR